MSGCPNIDLFEDALTEVAEMVSGGNPFLVDFESVLPISGACISPCPREATLGNEGFHRGTDR